MLVDLVPCQGDEYENFYVTRDGRVFKEIGVTVQAGYHRVSLQGTQRTVLRASLVAAAFDGPKPLKHVVRHKNGNSMDDTPGNCIWGTVAQNIQDSIDHGTFARGAKSGRAKLTQEQAEGLRLRFINGENREALAAEFKLSLRTIYSVGGGDSYRP